MLNKPTHKKRLYYTTGLISLILLPILCLWQLNKYKVFDKYVVIEVIWWNDDDYNKPYFIDHPYKVKPQRQFININLTGNDKEDKIKLDFAQLEIRNLVATKDTIKGVHIYFDNNSKYWSIVRAFDICEIEKIKVYIPENNDLWIYNYFPKPKPVEEEYRPFCGTSLLMDDIVAIESQEAIENQKKEKLNFLIKTVKIFTIPGILYLIMFILTIKRFYRKNCLSSFPPARARFQTSADEICIS